jgi:putative lipoprotein (rSAM/lipoprotein system)
MKQIQKIIFKVGNSVISGLLFIMGFSVYSCQENGNYEYGTPTADYQITGTVTSAATNQPIQNIKVKTGQDSIFTDAAGRYEVTFQGMPYNDTIVVRFIDVDGPANGEFQPLDKGVGFADAVFTGGDGKWYRGMTIKEADAQLSKKE